MVLVDHSLAFGEDDSPEQAQGLLYEVLPVLSEAWSKLHEEVDLLLPPVPLGGSEDLLVYLSLELNQAGGVALDEDLLSSLLADVFTKAKDSHIRLVDFCRLCLVLAH